MEISRKRRELIGDQSLSLLKLPPEGPFPDELLGTTVVCRRNTKALRHHPDYRSAGHKIRPGIAGKRDLDFAEAGAPTDLCSLPAPPSDAE